MRLCIQVLRFGSVLIAIGGLALAIALSEPLLVPLFLFGLLMALATWQLEGDLERDGPDDPRFSWSALFRALRRR